MMTPARPASAILGALLLAGRAREVGALQPVGDAAGDEADVGALQVDVSALQVDVVWWPWGKKHESTKHESTNDEKAPGANGQQTLAGADSDVLVGDPSEPGCYMRMLSGCPKKPMETHLWRHDAWAEAHELDKAGCEERKRVWDRYCEADDAKVFFVPTPPTQ